MKRFKHILIATRDYYQEIKTQLIAMGIPKGKLLPLDLFRLCGKI
jgi:hypothetical protein